MAAMTVTGRGLGMSQGFQKPENHCGCCCGKSTETVKSTPPKRGCVVSYKVGSKSTLRVGRLIQIKTC